MNRTIIANNVKENELLITDLNIIKTSISEDVKLTFHVLSLNEAEDGNN